MYIFSNSLPTLKYRCMANYTNISPQTQPVSIYGMCSGLHYVRHLSTQCLGFCLPLNWNYIGNNPTPLSPPYQQRWCLKKLCMCFNQTYSVCHCVNLCQSHFPWEIPKLKVNVVSTIYVSIKLPLKMENFIVIVRQICTKKIPMKE